MQAQENPLTNYMGFELWKHHPYISLTHHFYGVLLLVCPNAWYETLSKEERDLLSHAATVSTALQRKLAAEEDAIALARIQELNIQVLERNALDMQAGEKAGLTKANLDRLMLNEARIEAMAKGLEDIARLPDPVLCPAATFSCFPVWDGQFDWLRYHHCHVAATDSEIGCGRIHNLVLCCRITESGDAA